MRRIPWITAGLQNCLVIPASVLPVLLFGLLDYLTGPEISPSIFYLAPIYLAAWQRSRKAGWFITVLSIIIWAFADFFIGRAFAASFTMYWNLSVQLGFLLSRPI